MQPQVELQTFEEHKYYFLCPIINEPFGAVRYIYGKSFEFLYQILSHAVYMSILPVMKISSEAKKYSLNGCTLKTTLSARESPFRQGFAEPGENCNVDRDPFAAARPSREDRTLHAAQAEDRRGHQQEAGDRKTSTDRPDRRVGPDLWMLDGNGQADRQGLPLADRAARGESSCTAMVGAAAATQEKRWIW